MENIKTTYYEVLRNYAISIKKENYKKIERNYDISSIYSGDIGILIDDCLRVFASLELFK
ncbi:MAG: hypothetical protein LBD46_08805 [Endomicrobium sp.]|jgi:hypothetical protein|nr:hypothetical protein [Endomicrobium sp.]